MATTIEYNIKVNDGGAVRTIADIEGELKDLNEQIKDVDVNSEVFKKAAKNIQELEKELEGVNREIEGFTAEKKFQAADGAIKILGGSVASVVGSLGLLGIESEKLGKFEEMAASAISFGIGLKDVSEGYKQIADSQVLATVKAKIFGITTKQALIATGIGAFVVALGTVIAYWDDISKGVEEFGKKVPIVGKALDAIKAGFDAIVDAFRPVLEFLGILPDAAERANQAVIESNNELIKSGERELALLQARQASAEEIYAKREQLLQAELDNLRRTEADKEEIYKKETELLTLQEAERTRIAKEEEKKRVDAAKKAADERKKIQEDYNKVVEDLQEKSIDLKTEEEQAQFRLDLERNRVLETIKLLKIENSEKFKLLDGYARYFAIKQEELLANFKLAALEREEAEKDHQINILKELRDAQIEYLDITAVSFQDQLNLLNVLRQTELSDVQEQNNAKLLANKAFYNQRARELEGDNEALLALDEKFIESEVAILETGRLQQQAINAYYDSLEVLARQETEQLKLSIALNAAAGFASLLTELGEYGKGFAIAGVIVEKAAAIAQIIASTALANAKLVAAFPITLGQPWVGINTAGAVASIAATTLAATKAIGQINNPTSVGGTSTAGAQNTYGAAPSVPQVQSQTPTGPSPSEIIIGQQTVRAYVLTGDVQSGTEADAKLNTRRTLD